MKLQHSAINILDLVIIYKRFAKTQNMSLYCEYFYKNCTIKSFKSLLFRNFDLTGWEKTKHKLLLVLVLK